MHNPSAKSSHTLYDLKKRWSVYVGASSLVFLALLILLWNTWSSRPALLWFAAGIAIFIYVAGMVWRALDLNYRPNEQELLPRFGPGSALSLVRGLIVAVLGGFLFVPRLPELLVWIPAILKIIADLTDFFDGIAARLSNHATKLGELLDINLDGLGVLIVTLLAFRYGTVPWWYLPVGFARYLFLFGLWLRERRGKPAHELQPSAARRGLAALQMGFGTATLFPIFGPPETYIAATLFMLPFLIGFTYDWLQVSGGLQPLSQSQKQFWAKMWRFSSQWLPLGLRAAIVGFVIWRLTILVNGFTSTAAYYDQLGVTNPRSWLLVMAGLETFFMLMIALGAAGRPAAAFALLALGTRLQFAPFTLDYLALLIVYTALLFLGTGKYSLWRPTDKLIHHRIGEEDIES